MKVAEQPRLEDPWADNGVALPPRIWILADDRPGNVNQSLGLAEALGEPFAVKTLAYNLMARLPNWLLPADLAGITLACRGSLAPPWPDLVIGAGRRTAPIGRWLKRQNPALCLVQLMWPGRAKDFDLIAVPEHDRVPDHPVVMRTVGSPHRLHPSLLESEATSLAPKLIDLPRPYVACLVGGTNKHIAFTPSDAASLIEGAERLAKERGGSLLVTTSRRTDQVCVEAVMKAPMGPHLIHRWRSDGDNPYLGMLGNADAVVVSADSASMCMEACATGKPVFLHHPAAGVPKKFKHLHQRLIDQGCLRPLGSPWFEVDKPSENPANLIAIAVRGLLVRRNDVNILKSVASRVPAS